MTISCLFKDYFEESKVPDGVEVKFTIVLR